MVPAGNLESLLCTSGEAFPPLHKISPSTSPCHTHTELFVAPGSNLRAGRAVETIPTPSLALDNP